MSPSSAQAVSAQALSAQATVEAYHQAWTSGDVDRLSFAPPAEG